MKTYKCQDKDCGVIVKENERLALRLLTHVKKGEYHIVYKCPKCRGNLEEV